MSDLREFVFPCVDVAGVMVPEHRYAELEEVVRCRDCEHCTESMAWAGAYECDYIHRGVEPDGFCAWGERKGE